MPSITTPGSLSAIIGFTLPADRLDHDESRYLKFEPSVQRPNEKIRVPITDLRPVLENPTETIDESLKSKGYAIAKQHSDFLDAIPTEEGTTKYLEQCCEVLKKEIGCSRVIAWNSVCRRNEPDKVQLKHVERQQAPEKGFVPTSRLQPIAGFAHVDQDATWGKELCSKAAQAPADSFKRCQIINIWRPLNGPVTNAPLAVLPFNSLRPESISVHGNLFGMGHDLHHHPTQEWAYIRHQMPDEVIYLKCYDSANPYDAERRGMWDEVPFCAHVAAEVSVQGNLSWEERGERARESIEVRLVALWE